VKAHEPARNRKAKNRGVRPPAETVLQRALSSNSRYALAALALCVLTLLAYSNSLGGGLVLDNKVLLLDLRIRDATPEIALPSLSGKLATLGYLFPGLERILKPMLRKRGAAKKRTIAPVKPRAAASRTELAAKAKKKG